MLQMKQILQVCNPNMNAIHNVFMLHDASKYACLRPKLFVYSKYTMYVLVLYCIFMNRVDIPYSRSDIHTY